MTDPTALTFSDGRIATTIDLQTYRLTAVKKAAYRLAERLTAVLGSTEDSMLGITFTFKASTDAKAATESVRLFFQELLDQELREQIAEETAPMRTLILAHAFSKTDLINRE